MTRHPFRRFVRWLAALMAIYFVISAAVTTTVDPWRINNTPWALASIDNSRDIHKEMRIGKAALANRGTWQAVILGSSRMEIAIDPSHPAFRAQPAVNLALSGAKLYEIMAVGNYTLDRNPQIKTLVLGIDPGDLHSDADSRGDNLFYQSPFADNNRSIERTINQLIGAEALAESIATLQRHFRGRPSQYSRLGQMLIPPDHGNLRQFIENAFVEDIADQWALRPQVLRMGKAAQLAAFINRARQAGIETHIVVPPQHALKQIHPTTDQPDRMGWEADLRAVAEICNKANTTPAKAPPVKLWNFLTFNEYTTTPMPAPGSPSQRMPGWFDLGHAGKNLGDRVLDTIFSGRPGVTAPTGVVGVCLLEGDWNSHRAAWIEAHRKYCASHPQDVAWWRALVARAHNPAKAPDKILPDKP